MFHREEREVPQLNSQLVELAEENSCTDELGVPGLLQLLSFLSNISPSGNKLKLLGYSDTHRIQIKERSPFWERMWWVPEIRKPDLH